MESATTIITVGGQAQALGSLADATPENETRMIVGSNTLRTRRTPVNWAVICLIDMIQREHMAREAALAHAAGRLSVPEQARVVGEVTQLLAESAR